MLGDGWSGVFNLEYFVLGSLRHVSPWIFDVGALVLEPMYRSFDLGALLIILMVILGLLGFLFRQLCLLIFAFYVLVAVL